MTFYIKAFPYRLFMTVVIVTFVYFTPSIIKNSPDDIPAYYYVTIIIIYLIYQVPLRAMYTADMAFMARVSDPLVGGTYMTLLNTIRFVINCSYSTQTVPTLYDNILNI